jgi:Aspartyl/Asparaginyl beta-hydroxylase
MTQFPDRLQLPFACDPDRLVDDLRRLASVEWINHFVKQNYDGDWSVIPLRGKAGATHPVMLIYSDPTCHSFEDMPMLKACPYFREVLDKFACPLRAVRLMRLAPGSVIKEHTDLDLSVDEGTARFHIPVTTNKHVEFYLNKSRVVMPVGSVWYLRLSDPHSVYNKGDTDRVHMVIDTSVNDWMRALLQSVMPEAEAAPAGLIRQSLA